MMFKLQFDSTEITELAKRYGYQSDDYALEAGRQIRAGNYGRHQLQVIFQWKTKGRGKSRLLRNSDDEIADALHLASNANTERAAVAVLLGLHGVQAPVASAILTAIDPERYTVIDFRALEALGNDSEDRTVNFYLAYLKTCRQLASKHGVTLRDFDRALWQWSSERSA
jgi:hypothetical protein